MQQARQARIPVNLNAVLIGKKAVPKGCKVRNVSNQGLLLRCEADGRTLTFSHGDHVDIHLLFHRPNGTKYHTVAADVRHVDGNGIGVEFRQPDVELVKLIESYRVDDTISVEASITHRHKAAGPERSASVVAMPTRQFSAPAGRRSPADKAKSASLFYIGLLSLAVAVIIFTAGYLRTFDLVARVSQLETLVNAQSDALAKLQPHSSELANTVRGVTEGNRSTGSSVALAAQNRESPVAERKGKTAAASATNAQMRRSGRRAAASPSAPEASHAVVSEKPAASGIPPAPADRKNQDIRNQGLWVINLMSSPNQADADRFAENARKKGIQVRQTSTMLNGREYFRIQLAGFASEEQARASAGSVQEQLGLNDVWIFKP